jgi:hypothetical protein
MPRSDSRAAVPLYSITSGGSRSPAGESFYWQIATACWAKELENRPEFSDIVEKLSDPNQAYALPGTNTAEIRHTRQRCSVLQMSRRRICGLMRTHERRRGSRQIHCLRRQPIRRVQHLHRRLAPRLPGHRSVLPDMVVCRQIGVRLRDFRKPIKPRSETDSTRPFRAEPEAIQRTLRRRRPDPQSPFRS